MDTIILEELCEVAASFYNRRYAHASTGNISVKIEDRLWITPTGWSLRKLKPENLACVDMQGKSFNANHPSKELPFHIAIYKHRPDVQAVVHLHSTNSVALSCLDSLDTENPLPPLTPYYFMRVAPLGIVPYFRPGSMELANAIEQVAPNHDCILLRNHGSICVGSNLAQAADRAEELEEIAQLFFLLRNETATYLTTSDIQQLKAFNPKLSSFTNDRS
jgi:3-dehydro-4-phosphotetronate decarboxylase